MCALASYAALCYAIARDRVAMREKYHIPGIEATNNTSTNTTSTSYSVNDWQE
jgi:hypothetical protein